MCRAISQLQHKASTGQLLHITLALLPQLEHDEPEKDEKVRQLDTSWIMFSNLFIADEFF